MRVAHDVRALPAIRKQITPALIRAYAQASGDLNPLHLDPEFAARTHFGGIVAHGMLLLAFIDEMLSEAFEESWLAGGKLRVTLKAPAYVGDELSTFGSATPGIPVGRRLLVTCRVGIKSQRGQELLSGVASVRVPAKDGG